MARIVIQGISRLCRENKTCPFCTNACRSADPVRMTFSEELISIPYEEKSVGASLFIPSHPNHYGVILTHGAGGDMNQLQLVSFAKTLSEGGFLVLRFTCKGPNIKYRSKVYLTVLKFLHSHETSAVQGCFLAGRSMGSRAAVMAANMTLSTPLQSFVRGVVCLSYPLHTPHKRGELRDAPLKTMRHPCLFLSGSRDEMAEEQLLRRVIDKHMSAEANLHVIDGANHSYKVAGVRADVTLAEVGDKLLAWCLHKISCEITMRGRVRIQHGTLRGRVKGKSVVQTGVSKGEEQLKTGPVRTCGSSGDTGGHGRVRKRRKVE